MTRKYLVNTQHGRDSVEQAIVTMVLASTAAAMDGETVVFMTGDAVELAIWNATDDVEIDGYPPLWELVENYATNGGRFWVCPICAAARGITTDDLIPSAELAGAARAVGFVEGGARALM